MENDRIKGVAHQVKGAVIEILGKAIGDAKLEADGAAERAIGDKQNVAGPGGDQLIEIDADRIKGIAHQVKGAVMQSLGNIAGNSQMEADGAAERISGKAQNAAGGARDLVREAVENELASVEPRARVVPIEDQAKR